MSTRSDKLTRVTIRVAKTADGKSDYVQIMSGDNFTVNVVLIADEIEVVDARTPAPKPKKAHCVPGHPGGRKCNDQTCCY